MSRRRPVSARVIAALAVTVLVGAACSGPGQAGDGEPRRIVFSPGDGPAPAPTTSAPTGDGGEDGGQAAGADTTQPEPETVRTSEVQIVRLTADANHLDAKLGRVTPRRPAPGSECDVGPDGYQMIQCEVLRGSAGAFAVWSGQERSSRGLRVQVHRVQGDEFTLTAQSLLTRDFREVVLRVGRSAGEPFALIEYELDRQGNVHDFDIVTWRAGQPAPGPVASMPQVVSPKVTVDGDASIEALNYGDGAELCCPNYKDLLTLFLDPEHGWSARVQTVPLE